MFANNYLFILLLFQFLFLTYGNENKSEPFVKIEQGELKGKISEDYNGRAYYSFQGIPYAKPPIGELRFKAPVPAEQWTDIFDATKEGNECLQFDPLEKRIGGTEDCLNLNVYTPELPTNASLKPVMVWIHGGGFNSGSGKTNLYGPEFLITEDVVIVTINYRLGILGFLSLEDTSLGVPGNVGLKDMVQALKWVQKNIKEFNGDPSNVTIFGESAGSAACHYLILSESAKGLFHRAILQSGVAINQWAVGKRNSIQVAQVLESNATNEQEAIDFLMNEPAENFIKAQALLTNNSSIDAPAPFTPIVEHPNPEAFIIDHPLDIMTSGKYNKVPIIIGYTSREGMLLEIFGKINNKEFDYRLKDFEKAIPIHYNITSGTALSKTVAERIEDFYYGKSESPEEDVDKFYILTSDLFFIRGIFVTTRALLNTTDQPIYLYRFNIESALNIFKTLGNITAPGVCHADDLGYIFKGQFTPKIEPDSIEEIGFKRVVKLWTNFAKTGNPNPENTDSFIDIQWPPLKSNDIQCLDIDKCLKIAKNPEKERMRFWDEISAMDEINSPF